MNVHQLQYAIDGLNTLEVKGMNGAKKLLSVCSAIERLGNRMSEMGIESTDELFSLAGGNANEVKVPKSE